MRIKTALHVNHSSEDGFLLGTSEEMYAFYVSNASCMVAEKDREITGFGIILPDAMIRNSELWKKKDDVDWKIDIGYYAQQQLGYIEQLAFLPGYRFYAAELAAVMLKETFDSGVKSVFTTTVKQPFENRAALPLIRTAGGLYAGNIDEYYPEYGHINSDIYVIEHEKFYHALRNFTRIKYLKQPV